MACGTPVICPRVAAMPEFVRDGETGFIFDDRGQLTELLERMSENPSLVETMGRQARLAVEQEFDLKVAGAKLWALLPENASPHLFRKLESESGAVEKLLRREEWDRLRQSAIA